MAAAGHCWLPPLVPQPEPGTGNTHLMTGPSAFLEAGAMGHLWIGGSKSQKPKFRARNWPLWYLQIHPSRPTGSTQENPQQCWASTHLGKAPRPLCSIRLGKRSDTVNRNKPCIRNTSGPGGLEYPIQIWGLERFLDNRGENIPVSLRSKQEMQIHHHDAPAARQTLERSVQPEDVNIAFEEQHPL